MDVTREFEGDYPAWSRPGVVQLLNLETLDVARTREDKLTALETWDPALIIATWHGQFRTDYFTLNERDVEEALNQLRPRVRARARQAIDPNERVPAESFIEALTITRTLSDSLERVPLAMPEVGRVLRAQESEPRGDDGMTFPKEGPARSDRPASHLVRCVRRKRRTDWPRVVSFTKRHFMILRCYASHGWKGVYYCRRFRWHFGKHIDHEGTPFG